MRRDRMRRSSRRTSALLVIAAVAAMLAAIAFTRTRPSPTAESHALKGDVVRDSRGRLMYFDGERWTPTPPPPNDDAF